MLHDEDATGPLVSLPIGAMNSSSEPVLKTRLAICFVAGGTLYGTASACGGGAFTTTGPHGADGLGAGIDAGGLLHGATAVLGPKRL